MRRTMIGLAALTACAGIASANHGVVTTYGSHGVSHGGHQIGHQIGHRAPQAPCAGILIVDGCEYHVSTRNTLYQIRDILCKRGYRATISCGTLQIDTRCAAPRLRWVADHFNLHVTSSPGCMVLRTAAWHGGHVHGGVHQGGHSGGHHGSHDHGFHVDIRIGDRGHGYSSRSYRSSPPRRTTRRVTRDVRRWYPTCR